MAAGAPERGAAALNHPHPPIVVNRPARVSGPPMRVVLLNARGGVRFDGIVQCLTRPPLDGASIILLCESDWRARRSDRREVAAELAAALELSFAYVPEYGTGGAFMGNAILSAQPFDEVKVAALPEVAPPVRGRAGGPTGLVTRVQVRNVALTVGVAHLHSRCAPAGRERQMRAYLEQLPARGPAIVGGDFNTTTRELRGLRAIFATAFRAAVNPQRYHAPERYEPLFERLAEHGFDVREANQADRPTFTFASLVPARLRPKLDWLATREVRPVPNSAAVVPARTSPLSRRVSDHEFVMLDIKL